MIPPRIVALRPVRCPVCGDIHFPPHDSPLCVGCVEIGNMDPACGVISAVLMGLAITGLVGLFIRLVF